MSSDRENKVDDSVITVISPKKFDNPLSLQQKNNPRRPSSDIMPEECDARGMGTVVVSFPLVQKPFYVSDPILLRNGFSNNKTHL